LKSELVNLIGRDSVFMDVDSIALGRDFREVLHERLQSCDLMLVLIGPDWLEGTDAASDRRLDNGMDHVRQEIAAALKRNIPVAPVLLKKAVMPAPERLPADIKDLAYRNGFELGHSTWDSDVRELVKRLGLDPKPAAPAGGSAAMKARASWVIVATATAALVAVLLFRVLWQSSSCDLAAHKWKQTSSGACAESMWTFTPAVNGTWSVRETGCAGATGTARYDGLTVTADIKYYSSSARYEWPLDGQCRGTTGKVTGLTGPAAGWSGASTLSIAP
jgi:hypothetical protein